MKPELNTSFTKNAVLQCPHCDDVYLHHDRVEVFERGEDEEKGLHLSIEGGKANFDTNLDGNPSSRRHGIKIRFSCENCSNISFLCISQLKGMTTIDFEK